MPIYEYVCTDCGHTLEALQKISDTPLLACPSCAKDTLKKKISAPGFRLSGSGWYETDFKSKNQKNLTKGDSADSGSSTKSDKPDGGGSSKSDGKGGKEAAA
ncbi:zinc ribbon domain-containing protein [Gammaproteobacteria bacterium]|nr:zinc ribbon domain-containing protein [Gammaproteobacteria bacterium]